MGCLYHITFSRDTGFIVEEVMGDFKSQRQQVTKTQQCPLDITAATGMNSQHL